MCGIVGGFAWTETAAATLSKNGAAMLQSIAHRGRDGSGLHYFGYEGPGRVWVTDSCEEALGVGTPPNAMLGHRRLAILDPTDAGLQPMGSDDRSCWITFNGEIYNYVELRDELEPLGYRFRTGTDTEVLLAAYQEYGTDVVQHLNGMFAFGILDAAKGRLLLARDQLGIKPLYYCVSANAVIFASEIKGILESGLYQKTLDWDAVYHYFTFLYAPNPLTFFEGIRQLPPGHLLEVDLGTRKTRIERYWQPRARPEIAQLSEGEQDEALKAALSEAVRKQMRSDVPIGSLLSGGVDSTIITGLMTRHSNDVKTYTVAFPERAYAYYNEGEIARETSRHLGTEHHELPIRFDRPELIFELIDQFDQPFGNPTYYLMYLISVEAEKHMKVAMSGAGGDELFAGYPRYKAAHLAPIARLVPDWMTRAVVHGTRRIPDSFNNPLLRRTQSFFRGLDPDLVNQHMKWTYFLSDDEKQELLWLPGRPDLESKELLRGLYERSEMEGANRLLELDVNSFLVDNLLEYTDKMSMKVPLELRVPLLDPEFVELSLNIPFGRKLRGNTTKIPLRQAFGEFFCPSAKKAPKRGFNVPLAQWMRDSLDTYFDDASALPLPSSETGAVGRSWKEGLLSKEVIDRYRQEHKRGTQDRSYELFGTMIFDVWFNRYFG